MNSNRWQAISRSSFTWEQEAFDFLRNGLPDHEPFRAWSNFEFVADDGTINEVDALILTPSGLFLVEVKSRPGEITGDTHTWMWKAEGRPTYTDDNPLFLANRKAKKLASLLKRNPAFSKERFPFIEAVVFCSAPNNRLRLPEALSQRVFVRDHGTPPRGGLVEWLSRPRVSDARTQITAPVARAIGRALDGAGIRPTNQTRRVADYTFEKLLFEHPLGTYQDWSARHVSRSDDAALVRLYPRTRSSSPDEATLANAAAKREYDLLQHLEHVGVLQVLNNVEHETGNALIFRFSPSAKRLDHFLRESGATLGFDHRLMLLRQLAEAVGFAHGRRVAHRQLCPQSIYVFEPRPGEYRLKVHNWQLGRRLASTSATSTIFSPTLHADQLIEQGAAAFQAPEGLRDPEAEGEAQDVFSLGAVAYFLFGGKAPAESASELAQLVMAQRGLQLAAVLDGAPKALCDLIQQSTAPAVPDRTESVREFLRGLDAVENAYTAPEDERTVPPLAAKPGERIAPDLVIRHRLGSGSTATAFLVEWTRGDDTTNCVLKVASRPDYSDRVRAEFATLKQLKSSRIVEGHELREFSDGTVGILVSSAGARTLSQHLRDEGPLALEFLERFGSDLLEALVHLEDVGVAHRDLKPENIGIRKAKDGMEHLVLFDFSLSSVAPDNIRCGTTAYLDPFLTDRKPPRWDSSAERYSAALTLYEMATGDLPKWGPDDSHPLTLKNEILIAAERFDAALRDELQRFFQKALRRDFRKRYDNAVDMLAAWRRVFHLTESVHPAAPDAPATADQPSLIASATPETHLVFLGITNRAANALDRAGLVSVRDFLLFPVFRLNRLKGIGKKTVRELAKLHTELRSRFPDLKASAKSKATELSGDEGTDPEVNSLDLLLDQLLVGTGKRDGTSGLDTLRVLLGLPSSTQADPLFWPSQTDVAKKMSVTRQRIGQIIDVARDRWRRNRTLTAIRASIGDFLRAQGGAATPQEIAQCLIATRGSALTEPERSRAALAIVRVAYEAERSSKTPQFDESRDHGRVLLALAPELADYGFALGDTADKLADLDPLATPQRVMEQLRSVKLAEDYLSPPDCPPPAENRLLQLAVAASRRAALSARGEIYPRGMEPRRVLQLAQGALFFSNHTHISEDELQRRVLARYPDAAPLPPRPELDQLLSGLGSRLVWDSAGLAGRGAYRPDIPSSGSGSTTSTTLVARSTDRRSQHVLDAPGEKAADEFEARLQRAETDGAYLVLMVPPRSAQGAEARLRRRPGLVHCDFDALLIGEMKRVAARIGASWERICRADGAPHDSADWQRLQQIVTQALPPALDALRSPRQTVLLTRPGLLARYDRLSALATLSAEIGRSDSPVHGLWILLPCDDQNSLPTLLQKPVPVMSTAQWARVPETWVRPTPTT